MKKPQWQHHFKWNMQYPNRFFGRPQIDALQFALSWASIPGRYWPETLNRKLSGNLSVISLIRGWWLLNNPWPKARYFLRFRWHCGGPGPLGFPWLTAFHRFTVHLRSYQVYPHYERQFIEGNPSIATKILKPATFRKLFIPVLHHGSMKKITYFQPACEGNESSHLNFTNLNKYIKIPIIVSI